MKARAPIKKRFDRVVQKPVTMKIEEKLLKWIYENCTYFASSEK